MENQKRYFALSLIAYAVQRGIVAENLCRLSGINLHSVENDNEVEITDNHLYNFWTNAGFLTKDSLFGLHFGESLQLSALGIVGQVIQNSKTVGEAINTAGSLTHLITDLFSIKIEKGIKIFKIDFIPIETNDDISLSFTQKLIEFFMVFVVHELDGFMLKKINPINVTLPFEPAHSKEYERVFRCEIKNDKEFSMQFDNCIWNENIVSANYDLQKFLYQKIKTESINLEQKPTFKNRIYHYLISNSYLGVATLEEIAGNFNLSPRTFQRRLKEEGVNFQQLSDSVRKTLALQYIQSGSYPTKEISYMLGYNELSAFNRAFKRWTGASPVAFKMLR